MVRKKRKRAKNSPWVFAQARVGCGGGRIYIQWHKEQVNKVIGPLSGIGKGVLGSV